MANRESSMKAGNVDRTSAMRDQQAMRDDKVRRSVLSVCICTAVTISNTFFGFLLTPGGFYSHAGDSEEGDSWRL